jgi:formylglycine-generating enzyme required for sulfatase activity/predicted Ser/Thr protein kinase
MGGTRSKSEGTPSVQQEAIDDLLRSIAHAPAHKPPPDPPQGTRWGAGGRYVVERRLGRGGMGTVYAAIDTLLGRLVALKVLDSDDTEEDIKYRARLLREARLAARLEHERVARVYDVGEHEGNAFVAMEYIRGVTLREWMGAPRLPSEIVTVLTQIAEGLAVLHASGVVHRDLKPENVMLASPGGLKLVDFGLAGHVLGTREDEGAPAPARADARSVSAFMGTPGYMAPEQYAGERIDARADVFALGIVACELVTGERPFKGATMPALLRATGEPLVPLGLPAWSRFPPTLAKVVGRMLAREPDARFADGAAVVAALRELAPPEIAPEKRRRRQWWLAAAGVVIVAGAAVALEPRVAKEIAYRRALAKPPPLGMALINEGNVTVGQSAEAVARQCAEIGAKCPAKVLSYQVPATRVTVAPFLLDVREVTNREMAMALNDANPLLHVAPDEDDRSLRYVRFDAGLGKPGSLLLDLDPKVAGIEYTSERSDPFRARAGKEDWPVNQVTWFGARFYCSAQGKRLPTENEWEAAARGHDDRAFPWGNAPPRCGGVLIPNDGYLIVDGCPETATLAAVMTFGQDITPQGIHDLGGSVAEWVDSAYSEQGRDREDLPTADGPRVIRGGSFYFSYMARTSVRNKRPPDQAHLNVGLRCAADIR